MSAASPNDIGSPHQDDALIKKIETALFRQTGGEANFRREVPELIRRAIDEVIDSFGSNRFLLEEVEKTEKTFIGTKIERYLRSYLEFSRGDILDLLIDGIEVDIKNTVLNNWYIPREAIGHPCILVKSNEKLGICSVGIFIARQEHLSTGQNQDRKRSISSRGMKTIHWLLKEIAYPRNFWEFVDSKVRAAILKPGGGTERVAVLFRLLPRTPVSRFLVQSIAQQHDYMKRLRRNGGARDALAREGIAILWGGKDANLIKELGLPLCTRSQFISVQPENEAHQRLLRNAKKID